MSSDTAGIRVDGLEMSFPSPSGTVVAIRDISFTVAAGEFFCIVGPSGCGKTTLLRILAGLETATGGEVTVSVTRRTAR